MNQKHRVLTFKYPISSTFNEISIVFGVSRRPVTANKISMHCNDVQRGILYSTVWKISISKEEIIRCTYSNSYTFCEFEYRRKLYI